MSLASAPGDRAGQEGEPRCQLGPVGAGLRGQRHEPRPQWQELAKTPWPRGLLQNPDPWASP